MHPLRACSYYLLSDCRFNLCRLFSKELERKRSVRFDLIWFLKTHHKQIDSLSSYGSHLLFNFILFFPSDFSQILRVYHIHVWPWNVLKQNTHAFACSLQHGLSCARIQLSTEIKSIGQGSCMFELLAMTQPWVNNSALISRWSGAKNLRGKSQAFKCNREQLFVCTRLMKCVLYVLKVQCEKNKRACNNMIMDIFNKLSNKTCGFAP